jgi:hypothetical protein
MECFVDVKKEEKKKHAKEEEKLTMTFSRKNNNVL